MTNEGKERNEIEPVLPGGENIRWVIYQGSKFYSLVDIVAYLTKSDNSNRYKNPQRHWSDLKRRVASEGFAQVYEKIVRLKMPSSDGKLYLTDAADRETVLRIVQSLPSNTQKSEDIKLWLAESGEQRLQTIEKAQIDDPELAKERLRKAYERAGRSPTWIKLRLDGIEIRKKLTDEWQVRGIINGWEYAVLTNHISEETFGIPTQSHRDLKRLKKQDLREHYTDIEHALINLSEAAAHEFTVQRDSHGFEPIQQDAIDGGRVGGRARSDLESQGLKVVSDQNYLDTTKRKRIKEKRQKDGEQPQLFLQLEEGQE